MAPGRYAAMVLSGLLVLAGHGCKVDSAKVGEECLRSAQCSAGLACVQGVCTDDLSQVASDNTIPELGPPAAADSAAQDAGLPDAGLPDAGLPDAGLPDAGRAGAGQGAMASDAGNNADGEPSPVTSTIDEDAGQ